MVNVCVEASDMQEPGILDELAFGVGKLWFQLDLSPLISIDLSGMFRVYLVNINNCSPIRQIVNVFILWV